MRINATMNNVNFICHPATHKACEIFSIKLRNGSNEGSILQLGFEHGSTHEDIVGVNGDAVRNISKLVDDPSHKSWVGGVVGVYMADAFLLHLLGSIGGFRQESEGTQEEVQGLQVFFNSACPDRKEASRVFEEKTAACFHHLPRQKWQVASFCQP